MTEKRQERFLQLVQLGLIVNRYNLGHPYLIDALFEAQCIVPDCLPWDLGRAAVDFVDYVLKPHTPGKVSKEPDWIVWTSDKRFHER